MEPIIDFLVNIGRLKTMPRKRWLVFHGIKGAETVAEHNFRCAMLSWLMAKAKKLNTEKAIKISLVHDFAGVFKEDKIPYDTLMGQRKDSSLLLEDLISERVRQDKGSFKKELKSVERLVSGIKPEAKAEIVSLWLDYRKGLSKEGRLVKECDRMENLIQALEYCRKVKSLKKEDFLQGAEKWCTEPLLQEGLKSLVKKTAFKKDSGGSRNELDILAEFFLNLGRLKEIPRKGWVIRGIRNPETIAQHTFRAAVMVWIFGFYKKEKLDVERLIEMALVHDLCEVYSGDITPYDSILPKDEKEAKKLVNTWPRFSKEQREKMSLAKKEKEAQGLEKLISKLPEKIKNELKNLWVDYGKGLSPEGRFFRQADRTESLLQALEYDKVNKHFPILPWWVQARELFDDVFLVAFMQALDEKFGASKEAEREKKEGKKIKENCCA